LSKGQKTRVFTENNLIGLINQLNKEISQSTGDQDPKITEEIHKEDVNRFLEELKNAFYEKCNE